MKKIQIIIITFLFALPATTSYAKIYESRVTSGEETVGRSGGFFSNPGDNSGREPSEDYGGFFRDSPEDDLTERPGSGGGIGQEAPLGGGFRLLFICCFIYGIVKFASKNKDKN